MKVIVAGHSKTGTKSMCAALRELDYVVYDFMDHFWYHGKEWDKIFKTGASKEDFQRMYKDVDAVSAGPAFYYWEEIHDAFPDSQIILTTRDEESWYHSMQVQGCKLKENLTYQLMQILSPTGWRYYPFFRGCVTLLFGIKMNSPFDFTYIDNKTLLQRGYRQHQVYCHQNAPKDKLLVYSVKEGWEPLCKFLGKDVPDKPFPHENVDGSIVEKLMKTHPATLRMQTEMKFSISLLLGLCVISAFKLCKSGCFKIF